METKKSQPGIGFVIAVVVCAVIAVASTVGFLYFRTTPYHSLYVLKKAIINRDAPTVLKYLDTDAILDNMAKDALSRMDKKEPARNKFEEHMQKAGKDVVRQLVPQLKKQMGDALTDFLLSYDNAPLFGDLRRATVFALAVDVKGDNAQVRQRGKDKVSFTMRKAPEGHWRINWINSDALKMLH
ncbi:MAG: hypothetical protein H6Q52_2121 [Deltaproteobacteria bacterium]|nr:hypothetical protein [Deltaproteobacteria bacterium]